MPEPRRVKVAGDLFHPEVPPGAVYVGRSGVRLPASPFANPFRLKWQLGRAHPLRGILETAILNVTLVRPDFLSDSACDLISPVTPAVAVEAYRLWLARRPELAARARKNLVGRDLACWCKLPAPGEQDICHAAVLLEVANRVEGQAAAR